MDIDMVEALTTPLVRRRSTVSLVEHSCSPWLPARVYQ